MQAYKLYSNEYRQFPMRFAVDMCASLQNNDFGVHGLLECGNFTLCPPRKVKLVKFCYYIYFISLPIFLLNRDGIMYVILNQMRKDFHL